MNDLRERMEAGSAMRRRVLGDEYVDSRRSVDGGFGKELEAFVTEFCWGYVWTRPGLEPRVRSLVNVGMLAALNRSRELELHVSGALRNGCSAAEITEVLLQVGAYCGVPAAVDAFRVAGKVIEGGHTTP